MNRSYLSGWVVTSVLLNTLLYAPSIAAQVVPDGTLPVGERSQVSSNPNFQVDGGARRGGNLFHSFSEFSIPTGGSAYFNNAIDVQNILTRVTGGSISNIDGLIRANGIANLFLINPNGIIFGPSARLNIGGSFVASTASSIVFADGTEFSAVNPSASPLLTISVPIGLQFNSQPGDIVVQAAPENVFTETGDAGELLGTAQPANSATGGARLNAINGNLDGASDVDLYQLLLPQGLPFRATTVSGSAVDTQLFLFDGNGLGLASNDDSASTVQSSVPLNQPFIPAATGTYYLGVSSFGNNPLSSQGLIFGALGEPNDPSSRLPLSEWDANNVFGRGGPYRITLNTQTPLQVQPGRTLALVGGNVTIQGASLQAGGGRVELGGVAGSGRVGLAVDGNTINLRFPDSLARADVSLSDTLLDVRAGGGGSIAVTARNLTLNEDSRLQAGINDGLGFVGAQAGNIQLDATETIALNGGSIDNVVRPGGIGNAGSIKITTGSLAVTELAELRTDTYGQGDTGSVTINARDTVSLDNSFISSDVTPDSIGNTGGINITTGSLAVTGFAELRADTYGQGDAGSVTINARDRVFLDNSFISSDVTPYGIGNTGGINITTGSLALTRNTRLTAAIYGQGDAGSVTINARNTVSLDDLSFVVAPAETGSIGNSGGINITTGSLAIARGSQLVAYRAGQGNAGPININARTTVVMDGGNTPGYLTTGISSAVFSRDPSRSGGINIQAQDLILRSNAGIIGEVSSIGQGPGGDINLDIRGTILLTGATSSNTGESTRITSGVQSDGVGSGANLRIRAGALVLQDGGLINASTQGQGDAGNIDIQAGRVDISGSIPSNGLPSGLFTSSDTAGNAGDITIATQTFRIADGATLSARSRGDGQGGDISVNATRTFEAVNGGQLITTTFGQGAAGNITVNAGEQIRIAGSDPNYVDRLARFPTPDNPTPVAPNVVNAIRETGSASGFFANTEPNSTGYGGNIQITTGRFTVQEGAQLITSTTGNGRAGDITVNAPDIQLSGATSGLFAQTTTAADAGSLTIQPQGNGQSVRVNLQGGAQISASTSGSGNGGQLTITAPDSVTLTGDGSIIAAGTGGSGAGGNLNLRTGTLNIQNQAEVTVSSSGTGIAGNLFVDADRIYLNNGGRIRADTTGGGGNINLRSPFILLRNGSNISTNAIGENIPGGNISIDTRFLIAVLHEDSNISANSEDFRGGNVRINAFSIFGIQPSLVSTPLSDITATGATSALPGTIDVTTAGLDPTSGLVALPTDLVDASELIAQGCPADRGDSFVITGRGGLPPTPAQELDDDAEWSDREILTVAQQMHKRGARKLSSSGTNAEGSRPGVVSQATTAASIIEATDWQKTASGDVILIANTSDPTVQKSLSQSVACNGRR
ncbi:filamentous hemagglutinin N-terminal domain-containing protein [Leptolyngbya sp. FACHB-321]|uniref:two-partner secretion domain-containing protein n=1 Tax=Leptolyngbya sp. FACHB-321 TaxID=2692807 RepID=UPI00168839EE|nr:filamentous hemagglutinin N-terminal domain-containing protein [Leptolyngbya sp. FACHB-321]MBD2033507.1 filamentous hemagglutinin N-terminal domain-containing protein [Leptolyngbya sp. FACHB-321]